MHALYGVTHLLRNNQCACTMHEFTQYSKQQRLYVHCLLSCHAEMSMQAMMDCLAKKLVTTMPGSSGSVSLKTAVHSPEGVSVHSTSLQRKSRMSVSKAGGRGPFGDMTNNINVTPNRSPRLLQVTCWDTLHACRHWSVSTADRPPGPS